MAIAPQDLAHIDEAAAFIRRHDTRSALAALLPDLTEEEREALTAHLSLTHAAVLVFPPSLTELLAELPARGLAVDGITPSTVVRRRLAERYGLPAAALEVGILHAPVQGADDSVCEIEIFALAVSEDSGLDRIATAERTLDHEAHTAFEVASPDAIVLSGLRSLLIERAGMEADGGGYNAHEAASVFYFRTPGGRPGRNRFELRARGHHPAALRQHHAEPGRDLLRLMTGAWTTQAIALAAELRLADHLSAAPTAVEELAARTGTDPDSLGRLLRYLVSLGLLRPSGEGHVLTDTGRLLHTEAAHSMHPLALLYGGPFYRSFAELGYSVRTGREAFEHLHGKDHFAHFADHPDLADLFDRAMAASAPMFEPVAETVDFGSARVVVDVAGGNGRLLGAILRAAPHLTGVLLERPHVIEAARTALTKAGVVDRCRFQAGDFTTEVPAGGDVYILSRVLHDWDDRQCLAILRTCAEAMADHAELLVVERLLPTDGTPSLAVAWDVHMMCNVGGRERTAEHYRRLLAEAGLELTDCSELPLDGALLRARKASARRSVPSAAASS